MENTNNLNQNTNDNHLSSFNRNSHSPVTPQLQPTPMQNGMNNRESMRFSPDPLI